MRFSCCTFFTLAAAVAAVEFTSPSGVFPDSNISDNLVLVEGDPYIVQWSGLDNPKNDRISVTMWQNNGTDFFGDSIYIAQNLTSTDVSTNWIVNAYGRDISKSPMFYFNLFLEGETSSVTNSHLFNITSNGSSSSSSTSSSTLFSTSTRAITTTSTAASTSTSAAAASSPAVGMSTGAKAGIGIGISAAVFLGISAGWFIFGRPNAGKVGEQEGFVTPKHYDSSYPDQTAPQILHQLSADRQAETMSVYELPETETPQYLHLK